MIDRADSIRALKANAKPTSKTIAKRSVKMKSVMKILAALYPPFLKLFPKCEIDSPVCTKCSQAVNHTEGRGENEVLNVRTWEACCNACNLYIEEHDAWARQNGHKVNRHSKNE